MSGGPGEPAGRFRAEVRDWLRAHVPARPLPSVDTAAGFAAHREWEHELAAARLSVVSWPAGYGGRDASLLDWLAFEEEYYAAAAPARVGQNGLFLLAPTLFAIRASATPAGGGWLLAGTKTWSSRAAFADKAFGLFRSEPGAQRHRGLTYLMFDLRAEGVTVRPIRQLGGRTGFAEIFLDQVFVPAADVIGEPGDGWRIAMSTASHERGMSLRSPGRFSAAAGRLVELWRQAGDPADTGMRDRVVDAWIGARAYRLHTYATAARLAAGGTLGAESSLGKVFWSELDTALHETALDLLGPRAELAGDPGPDGDPGLTGDPGPTGQWLDGYLFSLAGPIYAGTNEIQRTVIAERLLGLPR